MHKKLTLYVSAAFISVFILLPLTSFGQTAHELEDKLERELKALEGARGPDGVLDSDIVKASNSTILRLLNANASDPTVLGHNFTKLDGLMWIATSPDGKLRIYSWDDQTGGSMRFFNSVFQFRDAEGKVHSTSNRSDPENGASPFFHRISAVDTPAGRVYLTTYTGIASSALAFQGLRAITVEGKELRNIPIFKLAEGTSDTIEIQYDFSSVSDRPERPVSLFEFGPRNRCFAHPVIEQMDVPPFGGIVTKDSVSYVLESSLFVIGKNNDCAVR